MKNKGKHQHRIRGLADNPLEKAYAKAWEFENTRSNGILDYLLAEDPNCPCGEVTERDREVAATVIQWLGSPVGQSFVQDVLSGRHICQRIKRDD